MGNRSLIALFSFTVLLVYGCSKYKRFRVTTHEADNIRACRVDFHGKSRDSDLPPGLHYSGFCYSDTHVPVFEDLNTGNRDRNEDGEFHASVKDLKANTVYFLRAYSRLSDGTIVYGETRQFTTTGDYEKDDLGPGGGVVCWGGEPRKYFEYLKLGSDGFVFGCDTTYINGLNTEIGKAANNSNLINQLCTGNTAAKFCLDFTKNNCDDWYLPTSDELKAIISVYSIPQGTYWSSTQYNSWSAYVLSDNGSSGGPKIYTYPKNNGFKVIAIRYLN